MRKFGIAGIGLLFAAFSANAAQIIVNGGFETGTLSGWTATSSAGSNGSFSATSGLATPLNGFPTVGAQSGTFYAVSDSFGPGSYALSQTFTAPVGLTSALLSFSIFVNDNFGASGAGGRVDLLAAGADPVTGVSLANFFGPADTAVSGGVPNPYVNVTNLNITAILVGGTSYQLRFLDRETDGPINVGVDSVSLVTTAASSTPEPVMMLPAALLIGLIARRAGKKERR